MYNVDCKRDCFAHTWKEGKHYCTALNEIDCKGCAFYKTQKEVEEASKSLKYKK